MNLDLENYETEEDIEYTKFCTLVSGDYDAFLSMTGLKASDWPFNYFPDETLKKFQARYLREILNGERPTDGFIRFGARKCAST